MVFLEKRKNNANNLISDFFQEKRRRTEKKEQRNTTMTECQHVAQHVFAKKGEGKSRFVPRVISLWGLIAVSVGLVGTLFVLLDYDV